MRATGLLAATMAGPRAWFHCEPGALGKLRALGFGSRRDRHRFPIAAILVQHPTAGALLVDSGLAADAAAAPTHAVGRIGTAVFGVPQVRASVAAQLGELGVRPQAIVMTHLHWDHAGGLADLPELPVLVSSEEWSAAQRPAGALRGYLRRQLVAPERMMLLDLSSAATRPWGPFARTLDLYGDGTVMLLATPGHSRGHLSLLLRLRDRLLLFAGDALYTMRTLRENVHPAYPGRRRAYERSIAAIRRFAQEHPRALVLPGHDLDAWESSGLEDTR